MFVTQVARGMSGILESLSHVAVTAWQAKWPTPRRQRLSHFASPITLAFSDTEFYIPHSEVRVSR
jgi:hypothetical protein